MITFGAWVIFPTDFLFLLSIFITTVYLIKNRQSPKLKRVLIYLFQRPVIVCSSIIFCFYLSIAILDSIHLLSDHHISTALDLIFDPLDTYYETTYSAPFSKESFSKSIVFDQETQTAKQVYKPLRYTSHWSVSSLSLIGFANGIVSCALISLILFLLSMQIKGVQIFIHELKNNQISYRTAITTIASIVVICSVIFKLFPNYHILGTDKVGQDVFYQSIKSIRTAFIIGFLTSYILLPFAVCLGIFAGYFGKRIDDLIQYVYTVISSVPGVLLIAAGFLSLQIAMNRHTDLFPFAIQRAEFKLLMLCVIMGLTSWTSLCRLVRAETLKLKQIDYVQAAKSIGSSKRVILFKHILPNLMHILIIATAIDFSGLVLAETVLSYIGIGVDPTLFSWGLMINAARLELARTPMIWWPLISAFVMMFLLVLSANLIADALRDALDPKVNH